MSGLISCKICSTPPIQAAIFVNHLVGKRHKKKAIARQGIDGTIKKCSIQIQANEDLTKFAEQLLFKYLKFNVVDAHFVRRKCFIEFKTEEDALNALNAKIEVEGLQLEATRVIEDRNRKGRRDVRGKLPDISPEILRKLKSLNPEIDPDDVILQLVKEIELKPRDKQIRKEISALVENFLNPLFPGSRTFIFGSSANNLGFTGCDVDMVADLGYDCWRKGLRKGEAEREAERMTKYLAKELRRRKLGYNVIAIGRARVPIIKFNDAVYGLEVDLSFKNGIPLFNTELIHLYSEAHAIVKPYMMFLRYWAKIQGISGGGHPTILLTNYCLCMMMLCWLMIRNEPIVPSVRTLQQGALPLNIIDGCNCSFRKDVSQWWRKYHNITLVDLAIEFFEFYGQMDCKEWIISPLTGTLISKKEFKCDKSSTFTQPLLARFNENKSTLQLDTPLCIQDPFDTTHNIARGFREDSLTLFQLKCLKAFDICKTIQEGLAPIGALFEEYDLDDVKIKNPKSGVNINDVTIVDEVVSLASNDSVELLQELESLERSGRLKELMENTDIDRESDDKHSESENQDGKDTLVPFISCEEFTDSHSKDSSTPVSIVLQNEDKTEEIIIIDEVSKTTKASNIELVSLDDTFDRSSDGAATENGLESEIEIIESDKSMEDNRPNTTMDLTDISEVVETSLSDSSVPRSISNPIQDREIGSKETIVLDLTKEQYKFMFDYYSKMLFTIDTDGSFHPIDKTLARSWSKDKCISDLLVFILKRVLLCDILYEDPVSEECEQFNKEEKKRKNVENYSSNKYLKISDDEVVPVKSDITLVSEHKCRTRYKIWEGRKKFQKEMGGSNLNPLQSEMCLAKKFEKSEMNKEFHLDFETRLWRDATKPTLFWVTVHHRQLNVSKVDNMFSHFYTFFSKLTNNLLHKIDGFNFRS